MFHRQEKFSRADEDHDNSDHGEQDVVDDEQASEAGTHHRSDGHEPLLRILFPSAVLPFEGLDVLVQGWIVTEVTGARDGEVPYLLSCRCKLQERMPRDSFRKGRGRSRAQPPAEARTTLMGKFLVKFLREGGWTLAFLIVVIAFASLELAGHSLIPNTVKYSEGLAMAADQALCQLLGIPTTPEPNAVGRSGNPPTSSNDRTTYNERKVVLMELLYLAHDPNSSVMPHPAMPSAQVKETCALWVKAGFSDRLANSAIAQYLDEKRYLQGCDSDKVDKTMECAAEIDKAITALLVSMADRGAIGHSDSPVVVPPDLVAAMHDWTSGKSDAVRLAAMHDVAHLGTSWLQTVWPRLLQEKSPEAARSVLVRK